LNAATKPRVHAAVAALRPGRTRLIVSHSTAALAACDRVVVLEAGRMVGQGKTADMGIFGGIDSEKTAS